MPHLKTWAIDAFMVININKAKGKHKLFPEDEFQTTVHSSSLSLYTNTFTEV